ncbi:MAG: aminodeoxychorismate synthase component I [bacterium]
MIDQVRIDLSSIPDLVSLAAQYPARFPFLFQSIAYEPTRGRYDFLFEYHGEYVSLDHNQQINSSKANLGGHSFLQIFDDWFEQERQSIKLDSPVGSGWCFLLSYEFLGEIEHIEGLKTEQGCLPVALLLRTPAVIVYDRQDQKAWVCGEPLQAKALVSFVQNLAFPESSQTTNDSIKTIREEAAQKYEQAIKEIHQFIREGDVFQVNLSRKWSIETDSSDENVYRRLSQHNAAPFAGWVQWQGQSMISSSPERLVSYKNGVIETRPIAGTRPRGQNMSHDQQLINELIENPKEQAEHVMLIDLERNDLGRVCEAGSIEVNEFMVVEHYKHVHHIVSNVQGKAKSGVTPGDVLSAVFPGGTITGCPKVRCMEIIAQLEQCRRGSYTGSMGYLGLDGTMDSNILIRSLEKKGRKVEFRAGAGIVMDSISESETEETRHKAKGIIKALS